MKIVIEIRMNNSAFENENGNELARILNGLASRVDEKTLQEGDGKLLFDINGNRVGHWEVINEESK